MSEEFDFPTRNEIDGVDHAPGQEIPTYPAGFPPSMGNTTPPSSPFPPPTNIPGQTTADPYMANLIGQLQGYLASVQQQRPDNGFNSTIKWLLIISFLVWLVVTYKSMTDTRHLRPKIRPFIKVRKPMKFEQDYYSELQ